MGRNGDVYGVIGKKPIHVIKPEDRKKASEMTDLWIDIGATSREDAEKRVSVGDPGVIDSPTIDFPNRCIVLAVDRRPDRRVRRTRGPAAVLRASRTALHVVAVATTQEEIAVPGRRRARERDAHRATNRNRRQCHARDRLPDGREEGARPHKIGGGPVLTRGSIVSPGDV